MKLFLVNVTRTTRVYESIEYGYVRLTLPRASAIYRKIEDIPVCVMVEWTEGENELAE